MSNILLETWDTPFGIAPFDKISDEDFEAAFEIALAEDRAPSGNPLLPRLDRVSESNALIAAAWDARNFTGQIEGGF